MMFSFDISSQPFSGEKLLKQLTFEVLIQTFFTFIFQILLKITLI